MASQAKLYYTPEQYLVIDRETDFKSEYISGEMVAMSGASFRHGLITLNVGSELRSQLKGKNCRTVVSDLRINSGAAYFYPDVVIVCGEANLVQDPYLDTLTNPTVIVEVLSKSTENYDRGIKFMRYAKTQASQITFWFHRTNAA